MDRAATAGLSGLAPAGVTADFLDETVRYSSRSFGLRRVLTAVRAVSPLTTA